MRISDWSSDVCSSDLLPFTQAVIPAKRAFASASGDAWRAGVRSCHGPSQQVHGCPVRFCRPLSRQALSAGPPPTLTLPHKGGGDSRATRAEEHTSELQSLMLISYAAFGVKKKQLK